MTWQDALLDAAVSVLIEVATGKQIKVGGCLPTQELPPRADRFKAHTGGTLPAKIDLRPYMSPVEDQSAVNSCASNAIIGIYEYLARRALGRHTDVSRLFVYYHARRFDGIRGDRGSTMTSNIRVLQELGACTEKTWPYNERLINTEPNTTALKEAAHFKLQEARRVPINLNAMRACLAEGYPFAFGLLLFRTFDRAGKNGVVPMPDLSSDRGRETHGCHAMLAVGYSDRDKRFLVRNSWGTRWGDAGHCYIPYDYLTNPRLCADAWTIEAVKDVNFRPSPARDDGFAVDYNARWSEKDNPYVFAAVQMTNDAALAALKHAVADDGDSEWDEDWSDTGSTRKTTPPKPSPKPAPKPAPDAKKKVDLNKGWDDEW